MRTPTVSFFFFLIYASAPLLEASNNSDARFLFEEPPIKKSDFPFGFLFGATTSAYQVEGAYLEDGKSLSTWDVYCHSLGCAKNGDNGDIADDHYHTFLEDIELMHSLGVQAYRFSISWARILPRGRSGEVNPAAVKFYNKIIDNLILRGIEPFMTIYHGDFPQELEDSFGSWLNPEMQVFIFSRNLFQVFWRPSEVFTMNEPELIAKFGYELGLHPPSRCSDPFGNCLHGNSDVEPLMAMHNMILAHGRAAKLYHKYFQPKQGGSIGVAVTCNLYEPLTDSETDHQAAKRAFAYLSGWTLDPSIIGDYPKEIKEYLGSELPSFSLDEKSLMKNSIDFIGINHYSTAYAKDCTNSSCLATENRAIEGFVGTVRERDGMLIGERTGIEGLYVVPRGMGEMVNLIKTRYNNTPMFITENGYSSPDVHEKRVNELTNDIKRVEYNAKYFVSLVESISNIDGADVHGYFVWSLMDCYQWNSGFNMRYGLYHVDRQTLSRIPKLSARMYKNFLTNNSELVDKQRYIQEFSLLKAKNDSDEI